MAEHNQLLTFDSINPATINQQLSDMLAFHRKEIDALCESDDPCWDTLMSPLAELDIHLNRLWSPFSHLNNVTNTDSVRQAYNDCLPLLTQYSTDISQHEALHQAIQKLSSQPNLDTAQKKIIEHLLRDFHLSGVDLSDDKKARYKEICERLAKLTTQFEENIIDTTSAWHHLVTDETQLSGLPDYAIAAAKHAAEEKSQDGYIFTLQIPSYLAVMQFADHRPLRQTLYQAFCTRASDQGPNAHTYDNSEIMQEIMTQRHALAQLLGFKHYAERSLATKMVDQPQQVLDFLWQLVRQAKPQAEHEFSTLIEFAKETLDLDTIEPWDLTYAAEKLKQRDYAISETELRPYFPSDKVIEGLFTIVSRLFNVTIQPVDDIERWHDDVQCYALYQEDTLISYCYFDLFARDKKRGGAWMDDAQNRHRQADGNQLIPIAFVTCNFLPPIKDTPSLLSHDDVVTLFHEFGHALQHMLTRINYLDAAGINGVPWDAVEICSQFLENWAWQRECMPLISAHFETGEPLPTELFDRLERARHFQSAMQMLRQLEFSLFDFILHMEFDPTQENQIQQILNDVRRQVAVVPVPEYNRFQHAFSHVFAGGYAAGYYSYKWAEVMAADAFSLFLDNGLFDPETSQRFQDTFLASGGAVEPMELFIAFRGREPQIDALLTQYGIHR